MADQGFQEKTEQATPKKLEDARQKGNVARSVEVNSAMVMMAGLAMIYFNGGTLLQRISNFARTVFNGGYMYELNENNVHAFFGSGIELFGGPLLWIISGIMVAGLAANIMQVGLLISSESLQPKFERLNPMQGIKKIMLSKKTLMELLKNIMKLTIIGGVAYITFMSFDTQFPLLLDQSIFHIADFLASSAFEVALKTIIAMVFIAAADYAFQKYDHGQNLMMSKQEVKDENRQSEGDPKVKSKIRSLQLSMSRNRMIDAVPEADVVITNPTHYAVALQYDSGAMRAPKVVAKGVNHLALKIREVAEEHNIPIMEDPPLARALYRSVEVDQEIPEKFFQALAEVLAYVYKLKN